MGEVPFQFFALLGNQGAPAHQARTGTGITTDHFAEENWLFPGSLRAGQRAAAVTSLVRSARLNGHDPYAYLRDILERLPTQPACRIDELLPHRWSPTT